MRDQFWEEAAMVVGSDGCESIVMIKASKLLHPRTFYPLSAPNIEEGEFPPWVISLAHLIADSIVEVHKVVDIDLYPFTTTEHIHELFPICYFEFVFTLLQKIPIEFVD